VKQTFANFRCLYTSAEIAVNDPDSPSPLPPLADNHPHNNIISAPWGHSLVLACDGQFKVKQIRVEPGHRLSLQRHSRRREHWYVVSGTANVEVADSRLTLNAGEAVDIPQLAWHRLGNSGTDPLVLVEIQQGSYFGEDDIERAADDYGRADTPVAAPQ
jgi:mannose-6-phosphate isomerase